MPNVKRTAAVALSTALTIAEPIQPPIHETGNQSCVMGLALLFGLPLLIAGAMISPTGIPLAGMVTYAIIVFIALPFLGWRTFLIEAIFPTPGQSRSKSLLSFWVSASVMVVAVLYFISSAGSYPSPETPIDAAAHLIIPFMPHLGLAIGLFFLSMLVSCGCWGAVAPILRPETALSGALITGLVLFAIVYGGGWLLILT